MAGGVLPFYGPASASHSKYQASKQALGNQLVRCTHPPLPPLSLLQLVPSASFTRSVC